MKELLLRIAQSLVDQPEKVEATEVRGSQRPIIEPKVAKSEFGNNNRQARSHGPGTSNHSSGGIIENLESHDACNS